ncbi:unnamed protein product (macronuclear) [Paramecium tetraurelia]|uniref:Uncharacterized protein n=1 Tax=Paramecium tetraurelia TaxID=5888 RepID=A0DP32_PARTE|nr:uncharacterized protein GSPATT00039707001 [Paramecium tetraurelia]CAK84799.1 unnamed protein product [Paramecium tetraurelia]|eukprot:XP_001452196.1 hypothetical protein (macronuclear) [Paramecium tetraurelia strain d4-2]
MNPNLSIQMLILDNLQRTTKDFYAQDLLIIQDQYSLSLQTVYAQMQRTQGKSYSETFNRETFKNIGRQMIKIDFQQSRKEEKNLKDGALD